MAETKLNAFNLVQVDLISVLLFEVECPGLALLLLGGAGVVVHVGCQQTRSWLFHVLTKSAVM